MSPRHRRIAIGVAVLVAIQGAAVGAYLFVQRTRSLPPERAFASERLSPRPAPPLAFERADGSRGELARTPGKVVMVHFWGTWCEPCRKELPALLARTSELAGTQFELLAVAVDDEWGDIERFFGSAVPPSIVRPLIPDVHRRFGARTLPDTYIVANDGTLIQRIAGARDWNSPTARAHLDALLRR